jgi:hypothetical protein
MLERFTKDGWAPPLIILGGILMALSVGYAFQIVGNGPGIRIRRLGPDQYLSCGPFPCLRIGRVDGPARVEDFYAR